MCVVGWKFEFVFIILSSVCVWVSPGDGEAVRMGRSGWAEP